MDIDQVDDEPDEAVAGVLAEAINNPELAGFSLVVADNDLGGSVYTESDHEYETHVVLAALMLGEHAVAVDKEPKEFIRDVVNEYNERDFIELSSKGQ